MKTTIQLLFFLLTINCFSQRYFVEGFDYEDFEEIDNKYIENKKSSLWRTQHAVNYIDINSNDRIDSLEIFKNSSIIADPIRKNNSVLRIELNKVQPKFFSKYACDDSKIENEFTDEKLNQSYNSEKNLYCLGCKNSPLGVYRYEWLTHMTRNEIATSGPERKFFKTKKHQWFGVDILIDESYELDDLENEEVITQFYNLAKNYTRPILSLRIVDKKYWLYIYRVGSKEPERFYLADVIKNEWTSWKYHLRISKNTQKSIIEIWKDDQLVLEKEGVTVPKNQRYYMKVGIYKWGWWDCGLPVSNSTKKVLFLDNIWANKENVSIGIKPNN